MLHSLKSPQDKSLLVSRRTLLAIASCFPALAEPARACTIAAASPAESGDQMERVRRLFHAWWNRDEAAFAAQISPPAEADAGVVQSTAAQPGVRSVAQGMRALLEGHFTDSKTPRRLNLMVNTPAGVLAGCTEGSAHGIGADCSGMPRFHLFLVTFGYPDIRTISHIASAASTEGDKVNVWAGN